MAHLRRPTAFTEESELASRTRPGRRDSDWNGHPRTHEEDLAWAAKRAAVSMAAATIHARDGGTGAHSDDVVHLCDAIAGELGVYGHGRAEVLAAAQLHDIGKVGIPQAVICKEGPLEDAEWALIREHTVAGEQIVQSVPELREVARLVRHSHERWDGAGYPDGLSGERIPLGSRIVFCADAFHAIRSDRPYRQGRSARAALEEVQRNAGSQFDPKVADALVKSAEQMRHLPDARTRGFTATLRSRRLASLLLTLAVGGSALAAGGPHVLPGDGHSGPGAKEPAPAPEAVREPADITPTRDSPATGNSANRGDASAAAAAGRTRRREEQAGALKRSRRRAARTLTPTAAAPEPSPAVPRRRRPLDPGRSGEAPRRPDQPGKPVGGSPGRSEEAPGRPSRPVNPPARPVKP